MSHFEHAHDYITTTLFKINYFQLSSHVSKARKSSPKIEPKLLHPTETIYS